MQYLDNLQSGVMLIGLGGRCGSMPGLLVGMGLGRGQSLPFILTQTEGGKLSSCSHDVSSRENLAQEGSQQTFKRSNFNIDNYSIYCLGGRPLKPLT